LGAAKDFNPKIAVEISLLSLARGSAFPRAEMPEELEWFKLSYRHKVQEKNNSNLTRKTERWESRFGLLQAACKANQIPGRVFAEESDGIAARRVPRLPGWEVASNHREMARQTRDRRGFSKKIILSKIPRNCF